jgi:hypothetical protein
MWASCEDGKLTIGAHYEVVCPLFSLSMDIGDDRPSIEPACIEAEDRDRVRQALNSLIDGVRALAPVTVWVDKEDTRACISLRTVADPQRVKPALELLRRVLQAVPAEGRRGPP